MADKAFRSLNRRHIYNVGDYLRVADTKGLLAQCFSHTYREKKYAFLIINPMEELRRGGDYDGDETVDAVYDTVLGLPVLARQVRQYVFGLPAIHHDTIYMIDVPNEPDWPDERHVLECNWGVSYL